ncbi:MAG TPA: class I SAM-dependent methyltransferase [Thermoanaerobaculia bacterium]|jgi:2-polyprenyl-3-methyl-5-hydroxy-6-metoxy-1,4-benzoquinol methylase|nr:class I SAM-dependent methyltransferase [Thermoanaerobaculia bacterium]
MFERGEYHYHEDVNWGLLRLWGKRTGLRVLDVGCGFATTSARIQKLGNEVTGIDSSPAIEVVAAQRLARVVHGDVVDVDLGDAQFDVIIFADVLEHLPWPVSMLQRYLRWLAPGGSVIVSLPNVGLWSVRFAHLLGRWEYDETGVLDRTHLRFFTRKSARWLAREAGLNIVRTTYNPGLVRPLVPLAKRFVGSDANVAPDALMNSTPYRVYLKTIYPLERAVASLWPGMLAFQMIFEAKR